MFFLSLFTFFFLLITSVRDRYNVRTIVMQVVGKMREKLEVKGEAGE